MSKLTNIILVFPYHIFLLFFSLTILSTVVAEPQHEQAIDEHLFEMDFQNILDIEVTSVSKRPEKVSEAASAIFVISQEDIAQRGITSIPEALRIVPGMQVGRIDANKWAISSRGFNSRFANKLLVMIDGRSVYTPLFAGVYWETLDMVMEDIERIEVIRGPGGTLWGANAVNGVVNIITKAAANTQGTLLSAITGNEQNSLSLRHGVHLDNGTDYRVYGKFNNYDGGYSKTKNYDDGDFGQAGFRADWQPDSVNKLTLQGDIFSGNAGQQLTLATDPAPGTSTQKDEVDLNGGNLLFRWQHKRNKNSDYTLQVYYDHEGRDGEVLYEDRDTFDLDFQHHLVWEDSHEVVWGLGYRYTTDNTKANENFSLTPDKKDVELFNAFIQDEITLIDYELFLTLGIKFEHNNFSGLEVQPNVRISWQPDDQQTIWGAISRVVRTPSRGEQDVKLRIVNNNPATPFPTYLQGSDDYDSEEMIAYEAGYRIKFSTSFSIDLSSFYNDYDNLRTIDPETFPPPELGLPFDNRMQGYSYGLEVTFRWQVQNDWQIQASYSFLDIHLELDKNSSDVASESLEQASPKNQFNIWSDWQFSHNWHLGSGLRYVDAINAPGAGADGYTELDLHLGWTLSKNLQLSLIGKNLLDNHHSEFQPSFLQSQATEVERSLMANLKWNF